MATAINRFQFLRGDFSGRALVIRPPWSLDEAHFTSSCTRCGDCLTACPEGLLSGGRGGFPQIDFSRGACDFCAACADACTAGALQREGREAWSLQAEIGGGCLALKGVTCRSCGDFCDARAIRFRLTPRGEEPSIELSQCNGCGACYAPCPVKAIGFVTRPGTRAA